MFNPSILLLDSYRRIRLRDGSRCRIRPVCETDRDLLVDCFARLSPDSRRKRFFSAKSGLSEKDLDFFSRPDGFDHIALVAVRVNVLGEEQEALGFARCLRLAQTPELAEMSLAVADDVQRLGVGSALLDRLTGVARSAGIRRFVCEVLADNRGMRTLGQRMGGTPHWDGAGTILYDWALAGTDLPDLAWWPNDSGVGPPDVGWDRSVGLWTELIAQAMHIGIDCYDVLFARFRDVRSFHDIRYPWQSAQESGADNSCSAQPRSPGCGSGECCCAA